jgi:hypothetical protein
LLSTVISTGLADIAKRRSSNNPYPRDTAGTMKTSTQITRVPKSHVQNRVFAPMHQGGNVGDAPCAIAKPLTHASARPIRPDFDFIFITPPA